MHTYIYIYRYHVLHKFIPITGTVIKSYNSLKYIYIIKIFPTSANSNLFFIHLPSYKITIFFILFTGLQCVYGSIIIIIYSDVHILNK